MAQKVFTYIVHKNGKAYDTAVEMAAAAGRIYPEASLTAIVTGSGSDLDNVCKEVAPFYNEVWKFENDSLSYPNAEIIRKVLVRNLPNDAVLLLPHDTFGMDLAPGLSIKIDSIFISDVVDFISLEDNQLKVVRQEFNGQVSTHIISDISHGAVLTVRPGVFQAEDLKPSSGKIIDKSADAGDLTAGRRFLEIVEAEAGDVDITKEDILVSVGRGIEAQENIEMVEELAEVVGGAVSSSRPIVDAKWLEKSRQVGTSGKTVKPKVYMALGISGSFQHLGGLKGKPFIVAVNRNPKAPIFQVADIGIVQDILEFIPVLTEKIKERK